eukprot:TRINITY_DN5474_c0_g1_i1.p1 TRINITY_DN5474_c0_g1~~TRINITY_DN5474_c0_g1_i1.p1  ORF type:complete len:234 (+),score=61.58 TRINITY_DN5474_c0_g1_i1:73-774(+)
MNSEKARISAWIVDYFLWKQWDTDQLIKNFFQSDSKFVDLISNDEMRIVRSRFRISQIKQVIKDSEYYELLPEVLQWLIDCTPPRKAGLSEIIEEVKIQAVLHYIRSREPDFGRFSTVMKNVITDAKVIEEMEEVSQWVQQFGREMDDVQKVFEKHDIMDFKEQTIAFVDSIWNELPTPFLQLVEKDIELGKYSSSILDSKLKDQSIEWDEDIMDEAESQIMIQKKKKQKLSN